MSHASIDRAANDPHLQERVKAAVYKTIATDDECRTSIFGQRILTNGGGYGSGTEFTAMYWAVAVATEAQYDSALLAGRGAPGHDADVITDAAITTVVTDTWPREQPVPPATPPA